MQLVISNNCETSYRCDYVLASPPNTLPKATAATSLLDGDDMGDFIDDHEQKYDIIYNYSNQEAKGASKYQFTPQSLEIKPDL